MINLKKPQLDNLEYDAVLDVLKSGLVAQGPKVKEFEDIFAQKCGASNAIAVNSGTAALHCILDGIGIGEGDEVICTSFSFIATASPILMCGARPIFVDINKDTFNIDANLIEEKITKNTKAIIAVNLFGNLADWCSLSKIANKHNLYLLEDAAQSHFACRDGKFSGNFAYASWFSFYATKNMMTAEGGMVTTNSSELDKKIRRIRQHGMSELGMYDYEKLGYNYRTTDINAAIGLVQIKKIDEFNKKRILIAKRYNEAFNKLPNLQIPYSDYKGEHVYHLYSIKFKSSQERDFMMKSLKQNNVACGIYYPRSLSEISLFKDSSPMSFTPVSKEVSETILSIPCEPYMSDMDIDFVIKTFINSFNQMRKES